MFAFAHRRVRLPTGAVRGVGIVGIHDHLVAVALDEEDAVPPLMLRRIAGGAGSARRVGGTRVS